MKISQSLHSVSGPRRKRLGYGNRGAVLLVLLVGLGVAATVTFAVVRLAAAGRQSLDRQVREAQAAWLAESALDRAAARLAADPNYPGETWTLSAEDLAGRDAASVAIRVEPEAGRPDRRRVSVEAVYPDDPRLRARQTRDVTMTLPKGPKP
jgi:Tfp pilus assembly protein PilX